MKQEQKGPGDVPAYRSYLLRLWRERGRASILWRASLQDPHSGSRIGFAHLDDLVAFLREQTDLAPPAEDLVGNEQMRNEDLSSEEGGSE